MKTLTLALISLAGLSTMASAQQISGTPFGIRDHSAFSGQDSCLVQNPAAAPVRRGAFVPIDLPSKTAREAKEKAQAQPTPYNVPQQPLGTLLNN